MNRRYFRRRWDESRGDQFSSWGPAVCLFETDGSLSALRQVEVYDGGQRLRYGPGHLADEFGSLAEGAVFGPQDDPTEYEIASAQFDSEWSQGRRVRRE